MHTVRRVICAALFLSIATVSRAATITLKDGQVVDGKIVGFLVLRGDAISETDKTKPDVVRHSVTYWMIDGAEVVRINRSGVERTTDDVVAFGLASRDNAEPDLMSAIDKMFDERKSKIPFLLPSHDPETFVMVSGGGKSREGKVIHETLLGEYQREEGSAQGTLLPSIRVTTPGGVVTIPVDRIEAIAGKH